MKFENVYNIKEISIGVIPIKCFCPIGKSECTYEVTIDMQLGKEVPDYIEVDDMVKIMDGQTYTLESAASDICEKMMKYVRPKKVAVTIVCNDAVHSNAKVVAEKKITDKNNGEQR